MIVKISVTLKNVLRVSSIIYETPVFYHNEIMKSFHPIKVLVIFC